MRHRNVKYAIAVAAVLVFPTMANALIMVSKGNDPVQNRSWPTGTEAVANLSSRLGYWEGPPFGGGEYHFEYQCKDTAQFNEALEKFSRIHVPRSTARTYLSTDGSRTQLGGVDPLLLAVHDWPPPEGGPGRSSWAGDDKAAQVAWTFQVWIPENYYRLFKGPEGTFMSDHPNYGQPVPPPRIDVYVGGESPIDWDEVKVPASIQIHDLRAEAAPMDTSKGGVIRGGVFDMSTHQVVAGADVIVKKREGPDYADVAHTKTDADGRYEIREIPEGYHRIEIHSDEHVARIVEAFDNRTGHAWRDADTLLAPWAGVAGLVVGADGKPIAGARVSARNIVAIDGRGYEMANSPVAVTDEEGRFVLGPLPDGFGNLRCDVPEMHQETSINELYRFASREYEQRDDVEIVMVGTGVVRGKVVDKKGKPPSRPFIVELEPAGGSKVASWGGSSQVKDDGTFEFQGVPPDQYTLTARPNPGSAREATSREVTVEVGKTVEIEIPTDYAHER